MSISITYNGEVINNVNLTSFRSAPIYEDMDTQVIANRVTISAVGTISADSADATTFVNRLNTARQKLSEPRADLLIQVGGVDWINVTAPDAMDGPKPRSVEFTDIVGIRFAFVSFEIEVIIAECGEPSQSLSGALTHTFSVIHQLDHRFMTTRTITGVVTTDTAQAINPDSLRNLITPKVPSGFHRESMRFGVTATGTRLEYELVDMEDYIVAPKPAVRASGTYTLVMTSLAHWVKAMDVEIEGPKNQTKLKMMELAFIVILGRFTFSKSEKARRISIEESLYENRVRLSVTADLYSLTASGSVGLVPTSSTMFQELKGSESNQTEDLGPYGSALIQAAEVAFYDKCVDLAPAPAGAQAGSGQSSGPTITTTKVAEGGRISGSTTGDHQSGNQIVDPYILYEESCAFNLENGIVLLPSTKIGKGARVYQTHVPYGLIIQTGRAIRLNTAPTIPPPAHTSLSIVRRRSVQHHTPQLSPDNRTFTYSSSWRYEIWAPFGGQSGVFVDQTPPFKVPSNQITDGTSEDSTPSPEGYKLTSPNFTSPGGQ